MPAFTPRSSTVNSAALTKGADVSIEQYETLAGAILDVAVGDINEMKAAMWRIIGSAPAGTDPARLLRLTITRLGSR